MKNSDKAASMLVEDIEKIEWGELIVPLHMLIIAIVMFLPIQAKMALASYFASLMLAVCIAPDREYSDDIKDSQYNRIFFSTLIITFIVILPIMLIFIPV